MKLEINLRKSLQENAAIYYEKSKKISRKIKGLSLAIEKMKKRISMLEKKKRKKDLILEKTKEEKKLLKKPKRNWYEKFHWFFSSNGFLVIGGKDVKSNEQVVKKHMDKDDVYLHADYHGAPHVVIKATKQKKPDRKTLKEAAMFAAVFSRAWRDGLTSLEVFYVKPEQVSLKPRTGEYLPKGAFMIYGKKNYLSVPLSFAVGVKKADEGFYAKIVSGPPEAIKINSDFFVRLEQGRLTKNEAAKKLHKIFRDKGYICFLDDLISALPSGNFDISQTTVY